jgi:hypothetical protein
VKRTNIADKVESIGNTFRTPVFAGMAELYSELIANSDAQPDYKGLIFLSGSATFTRASLQHGFRAQGFPEADFLLMNWLVEQNIEQFKQRKLEKMRKNYKFPFVMIGDDTQYDPTIYTKFAKKYPEHSLAIYIRKVNLLSPKLPSDTNPFITAFDIAARETEAGRLNTNQALHVGEHVLQAEEEEIIPDYAYCPTKLAEPALRDTELQDTALRIRERVLSICANR